jgi:transketolase
MTDRELELKAWQYRRDLLRWIRNAGAGHTGGSLSCVDILTVLYHRILKVSPANWRDPLRDRYVQSKGHSVEALYVVLADCGFFPATELGTLCRYASPYVGHPTRKIAGIEHNTGALGHGLGFCVGLALAGKRDRSAFRVFTLLGDGELAEGSNWEAAMAAAHYRLDNLFAIVDRNTLQISGRTWEVCNPEPLDARFAAFGWAVRAVDGHDLAGLTEALSRAPASDQPTVVLANTRKGRGVSFMEDDVRWHHGVPTEAEYERAVAEMDAAVARLQGGVA